MRVARETGWGSLRNTEFQTSDHQKMDRTRPSVPGGTVADIILDYITILNRKKWRIPAKCAAVPALSAAFSVSLVRKFCVRPPRGSWTKPLNKVFFKLLLVRALSGSSMAWVLPCSGLVRFFLCRFFSVFGA